MENGLMVNDGLGRTFTYFDQPPGGEWKPGRDYMHCIGIEDGSDVFSVGTIYTNTETQEKIYVQERTVTIPIQKTDVNFSSQQPEV